MQTLLIVVHLLIVLALVGTVLLQRSEGGGLGIGGGGGNAFAARGSGNALTRATGILAAAFFATSLALSLIARYGDRPIDILDRLPAQQEGEAVPSGSGGVLDQLGGEGTSAPSADDQGAVPAGDDAPSDAVGVPSGTGQAPADDAAPAASDAPAADAPAATDEPAAEATEVPAGDDATDEPSGGVPTGQ